MLLRAELYGGDSNHSSGVFADVTGDRIDDLIVCYELWETQYICEVWTLIDGTGVRIASVDDFHGVAGNGSVGINLIQYSDAPYLCFWQRSEESGIPDPSVHYEFSVWSLNGRTAESFCRFGADVDTSGQMTLWGDYRPFRIIEQAALENYIAVPDRALCRSWDGDGPIGDTLEHLLARLTH